MKQQLQRQAGSCVSSSHEGGRAREAAAKGPQEHGKGSTPRQSVQGQLGRVEMPSWARAGPGPEAAPG